MSSCSCTAQRPVLHASATASKIRYSMNVCVSEHARGMNANYDFRSYHGVATEEAIVFFSLRLHARAAEYVVHWRVSTITR